METEVTTIRTPSGEPNKVKIQYIVMEDILFRTPLWGILIAVLFGGVAWSIIWFILNVMEPYMKENLNKNKTECIESGKNIYPDYFSSTFQKIKSDAVMYV